MTQKEDYSRLTRFWAELFDLIAFMVFMFWIVLSVRFFVFSPYTVLGASMMPNFSDKDWIIVEKLTQKLTTFERWDVVVFVPSGKSIPYIKRVIWLPWETVLVQDDNVYICNKNTPPTLIKTSSNLYCEKLNESYLPAHTQTIATCWMNEFPVVNGYFVMWDNRGRTTDSLCCFGIQCYQGANYTVSNSDLIGKVWMRLFPQYTKF